MDPISSLSALYKMRKILLELLWGLNEIKYLIRIQFLRYSRYFTYKLIHSYKLQFFSAKRTPQLSPDQFSHSVVPDSLWPHGVQQARPPCPSPTPGVYPNSCPLSWWCHPTISSFVIPFSSHSQSFPASGSFQMSQFFASGGQIPELQHQSFQWIFRIDFL